ncbi:hypothetical protein IC575_024816 [Cucumis melo]
MEDSSEDEREMLPEVRKKSFVPHRPTTMSELALVRNSRQKLSIQFNEHGQPVGATSKKMQSYIGVCVRQQIPITYNSWKEVPNELKDKIYDCISFPSKIYSHINQEDWESFVDARLSEEWEDELVATNKNEDILTDALGSKEHGGRVRGVGGFVSQSQYFNTVKGKEKMCHKEEDDSRCKSDKKRSNHSRSSIGSINIDLDVDEDTPTNKRVEDQLFLTMLLIFVKGTPCQLSIGSINNIVVVATIVEDNSRCPNVKVLVDVVMGENLTILNPVKGKIKTLNQALGNIIEWPRRLVSTINDKQVFHWMLHVIDLRKNCVYVLDSLRSKVNEDIHGIINVGLKTWQAKHDLQRYRSTPKWRHVKCPRQLDSVGYGYYVQKYIHEIVHNSSTSITSLFNTKNGYRQEEIDEIQTEWAALVNRYVCWMIVFAVVLYGSLEKCARILVLDLMHLLDLMHCVYYWFAMDGRMCCLICVIIYISGYIGGFGVVGLIVLNIVFYMEVYAGILGIIVCIASELVIRH